MLRNARFDLLENDVKAFTFYAYGWLCTPDSREKMRASRAFAHRRFIIRSKFFIAHRALISRFFRILILFFVSQIARIIFYAECGIFKEKKM